MDSLGDSYIDKNALRRAPIDLIAVELGVSWTEDGRALCPFHDDHRPSFEVWWDERGPCWRWGCFPCGASGDVFDLVQRLEGLSFNEALERVDRLVRDLPAERRVAAGSTKPKFDLAACEAFVAEAREIAAANEGWLCVTTGLVPETAPADYRAAADSFLREELRWGVDHEGHLVMPHYDAADQLMGAKIRALDGDKWCFPGTTLSALYGAWRPRKTRYVLLTEGEGDVAYALLQSPPVDALSLPAGARSMADVPDAWRALEADVYFLAFDSDEHGFKATDRWLEALRGRDVRVCRLPRGHDLKSARPVMADLLRGAVKPVGADVTVTVLDGRFVRQTRDGPRVLTSWYCEPVARLESLDGETKPALEVQVHHAGQVTDDVITLEDLGSAGKLRGWAARRSLDCLVNDTDAQHLGSLLLAQALTLPEVFQTARLGSHAAPARYRYTGRTVVAPSCSIGRLPWRYVGPSEAGDNVLLCDEGRVDWRWLDAFLTLNEASVTHPLLAWLIASARRDELTQFPLLFLGGSSGSGKTTTAQLAVRLMGSKLGVSLASVTQFALIRALAMTTTLPVFVDEWSLQSRSDARETVQAVVPVIYDGGVTPRGRSDLTVVEYRLTAPVVIAGEDSFHLDREADRMIALRLRRQEQHLPQLEYLVSQPIHCFGRWFSEWLVSTSELPEVPTAALTRPAYNRAVLELGWATLLAYLGHAADHGETVPALPLEPDLSQLEVAAEGRENEYEAFLAEALAMRDGDGHPLVWSDELGRGTWVRFRVLTAPRNIASVDVELPGRSRAMKGYFADRYQLTDERVAGPYGGKWVRATLIHGLHLDTVVAA